MAKKDFGAIENDYAFFMTHATEAENDAAAYCRELEDFASERASIRMLDFGCGNGEFTQRLLSELNWSPELLQLTIVEPVRHQREQAAQRLTPYSRHAIEATETLTGEQVFDLVLSNHTLYYVDDLAATLRRIVDSLAPRGKLLLAIAGWENPLLKLWQTGFARLGRPVPYYAAEDVQDVLTDLSVRHRTSKVHYQLAFPDNLENRLRILRFLFGEYLQEITPEPLLSEFDEHVREDHIHVETHSLHFLVEPVT